MSKSFALVTIANCRLGTHPKRGVTQSGQDISTFNVAYEDGFGKDTKVIWVGCTAFGSHAKLCNRFLYKGACITISGRLSMQEWYDKNDVARQKMHVIIEHVVFNDTSTVKTKQNKDGLTAEDFDDFEQYEQRKESMYAENEHQYQNTMDDFEPDILMQAGEKTFKGVKTSQTPPFNPPRLP